MAPGGIPTGLPRLPAGFTSAYAGFTAQTQSPGKGRATQPLQPLRGREQPRSPRRSPPRAPSPSAARAPGAGRERRPRQALLAAPGEGSGSGLARTGPPRLRVAAAALTAPGHGRRLREGGRERRHRAPRRRSGGGPGACAARGPGWAGPDVSELPRGGGAAMAGE